MKVDKSGRIIQFSEKPKGLDLKAMVYELIIQFCYIFFKSIVAFDTQIQYETSNIYVLESELNLIVSYYELIAGS